MGNATHNQKREPYGTSSSRLSPPDTNRTVQVMAGSLPRQVSSYVWSILTSATLWCCTGSSSRRLGQYRMPAASSSRLLHPGCEYSCRAVQTGRQQQKSERASLSQCFFFPFLPISRKRSTQKGSSSCMSLCVVVAVGTSMLYNNKFKPFCSPLHKLC